MPLISRLLPEDHDAWEALFRAYCEFYGFAMEQAGFDRLWAELMRDERMHAFGARKGGALVGIVHFLPHANTWGRDVCYLEDLFTHQDARGQGIARALIAAVTDWAREADCGRVYWMTHDSNTTARRLYDQVAANKGFIRYQIEL